MKTLYATLIFSAIMLPAAAQSPAGAQDVTAHCESCHGAGGNSSSKDTPRLNGQSSAYLQSRLEGFLRLGEQSPHALDTMWPVIMNMDSAAKKKMADYFAGQAPTAAHPATAASNQGRILYEQGLPALGMSACQSCHGMRGEGGTAAPRLAGQHREYLASQLWAFNLGARIHGTMNVTAMKLLSDQIDSLAAYLSAD